jgi:D-alanyl-D-alanine carboxypeptidase
MARQVRSAFDFFSAEPRARAGRLLDQGAATGAVVRVDDGHRVVQFAVGVADLKPRRELGPGDEFRVGSTTRTFMAALALQLVAERRLGSRSAS